MLVERESTDDPFAALERAAERQALEEQAASLLKIAKSRLVLGRDARAAFFASLALKLDQVPDWELDTAATDGRTLHYNPRFVAGKTTAELMGIVCHEVMHNALCHHTRRGTRDPKLWNVACDLSINPLVIEGGFTLPRERLVPGEGEYAHLEVGLSAEEYYSRLSRPRDDEGGDAAGGGGPGDPDPGKCGGVREPGDGSQSALKQAEAEAKEGVAAAVQLSRQRGTLPGGLARLVEEVLAPKVDWREVLREFISRWARNDYSFSPPNRRYVHMGLYLPGLRSEELGDVVVAVDTSGSISREVLARFAGELQGILESYDVSLTVIYHDARVTHTQAWRSSDGPLVLEARGGGGTSHRPVFEWVEGQGEEYPSCAVCLTDLYTDFPAEAPPYPVLWAVVGNKSPHAPFGAVVSVE